jgi:hypothetical protein
MTWLLPKASFGTPVITQGIGTIGITDSTYWLVTATSGTSLKFSSVKLH